MRPEAADQGTKCEPRREAEKADACVFGLHIAMAASRIQSHITTGK